jgi:hypothetical protein
MGIVGAVELAVTIVRGKKLHIEDFWGANRYSLLAMEQLKSVQEASNTAGISRLGNSVIEPHYGMHYAFVLDCVVSNWRFEVIGSRLPLSC